MEVPKIRGVPYNEDYSILGSLLGSPYFGKRVRRNTGPSFSVKACVFHVFLRIASIKTIGSRMEISYVFFL